MPRSSAPPRCAPGLLNPPGATTFFAASPHTRYIALEAPMHRIDQLQFRRLPPEAQRAALWRLAWSGLPPEQIAQRVGWTPDQVRRAMDDELAPARPRWTGGSPRMAAA